MKALVVSAAHRLELLDVPMPRPGPFEALVRIEACGICNTTDTELVAGTQPYHKVYPAVLGHEAVGRVEAIGKSVRRFRVGDRVTRPVAIHPGTTLDGLASCWGGFAEYGLVRDAAAMAAAGNRHASGDYTAQRQNVVDPRLDLPQAVVAISLAETASWVAQLGPLAGRRVCVSGTGVAGLSIALWCKRGGCRQVIVLGRRPQRLAIATVLGADATVNVTAEPAAAAVLACSKGGVDLYCDAAGSDDQLAIAQEACRPGGVFARYAVEPAGGYRTPQGGRTLTVTVPEAREHEAYRQVTQLLLADRVQAAAFLTHDWPLKAYAAAFRAVAAGEVLKSMLMMSEMP